MTFADKTDYARSQGYTGKRPVRLQDGKVISHRNQDWFDFCGDLRHARLQRLLNAAAPRGPHVRRHKVWCGYRRPVFIRAHSPDHACELLKITSR
jgi:hypothetical protein